MLNLRLALAGLFILCPLLLRSSIAQSDEKRLPLAITAMPDDVQQAWLEAQAAVAENENLENPLPDPYFARAEIWSAAGVYDSALRDYLKAVELAAESGGDPSDYASWLSKLAEALDKFDKAPSAPGKGDGSYHYSSGVHAFWNGDMKNAVWNFDNAIFVEPAKSLYWYFRALTYLRRGDQRRAKHDALIGSNLEWQDGRPDRIGWAFARLQGPMRMWLERYRLGDPSNRIINEGR